MTRLPSGLIDDAGAVLREAAATAILPRYRALAASEIEEKSPGELVTVADREAEAILTRGLAALLPGSRVIGEEACAADPSLIDAAGEGLVWLVDPLDGTANFAAGEPVFAVMAALLRDGEPIGAWILDPLEDTLCSAELGAGAHVPRRKPGPSRRSDAGPRLSLGHMKGSIGRFMPPDIAAAVAKRAEAFGALLPNMKCAGAEYPAIAAGERDFAFYWRTLAWDHAAGVLLLNEAGGKAARPDGSPYRPGGAGSGLLAARSPEAWEMVQAALAAGDLASRSNA